MDIQPISTVMGHGHQTKNSPHELRGVQLSSCSSGCPILTSFQCISDDIDSHQLLKKSKICGMFAFTGFFFSFLFSWSSLERRIELSPLYAQSSKSAIGRSEEVEVELTAPAIHVSAKAGRIGANLGYFYLQKELKLSEHHMMKIMEKYPWIMYLKVDTNLRPTVEVLKSFGFRDKDVRSMLEKVPPILGINHEWTLPEKLISIQKMFNLNRAGLVKLVVHQPFLLTCSIDRNIKVSEFLSETVGLSPESIRNCLLCCPEVAMSGITKMAACWSVLTDIYGLSDKQARALVMYYPIVLTHRTLKTIQDKVSFFSEELNMSPPFREVQKVIMRYPQLLCIDPNVFMRPNAALLRKYLELDREGIAKLISFFPSALGYNPRTLERSIRKSLFMLTGLEEYTTEQGIEEDDIDDDIDDIKIFQGEVQDINNLNILQPLIGQGLPLTIADIQSIERVASSILNVQDGDILSLHILPSSMNPFLFINENNSDNTDANDDIYSDENNNVNNNNENNVSKRKTESHIVITNSDHNDINRTQVNAEGEIEISVDEGNSDDEEYREVERGDVDVDDYDDDSLEIQENLDFYETRSKGDEREKENENENNKLSAESTGVDVLAEIVARSRIKMEGKQGQFIHPLANITNILTSVGSVVSLETEAYIDAGAMAGPEARAEVTLKNFFLSNQFISDEDTIMSQETVQDSVESESDSGSAILRGQEHYSAVDAKMRRSSGSNTNMNTPTAAAHAALEIEAMRLMMIVYSTLNIDKSRALGVVKSAPWVLSYRPERSLRMLSTIGFSLGMSRSELSKLVRSYPRVLSLSVDGKIKDVLTALAVTASTCLLLGDTDAYIERASLFKTRKGAEKGAIEQDGEGENELITDLMSLASALPSSYKGSGIGKDKNGDDVVSNDESNNRNAGTDNSGVRTDNSGVQCCTLALTRRRDPVRTMVRTAVLKWPLLLGTSMSKITAGLEEVLALEVPYDQLIQIIRRNPKTQSKWKAKVISMAKDAKLKKDIKIKKDIEKKYRDEDLSRTYYENEIDFNDDFDEIKMESEAEMEIVIVKEEEKKKAKLEKKKKKAEFIEKIKKVLKPILKKNLSTTTSFTALPDSEIISGKKKDPKDSKIDIDMTAIVLDIEIDDKKRKKKKTSNVSNKKVKATIPE